MISSADIEENHLQWTMIDKFVPTRTPIVLNTDTSSGPGIHWIVAFIHQGSGYVFDSLGPHSYRGTSDGQPSDPILRGAFSQVGVKKIHFYPYTSQLESSSLCGWFAIYSASMIRKYLSSYPHASASELDAIIESRFGTSADGGDERVLEAAFTPSR